MARCQGVKGESVDRGFYGAPADELARDLLGLLLVRRLSDGRELVGRIVETEAYLGVHDRASHAFGGRRTVRNESMYARPGTAYVYLVYGVHHCFNVVCGKQGEPAAVLVRGVEPLSGFEDQDLRIGAGPGKLCKAMRIDRGLDGADLVREDRVFLRRGSHFARVADEDVVVTARVGVAYAREWAEAPLRFLVRSSPGVSRAPSASATQSRKRKTPAVDASRCKRA